MPAPFPDDDVDAQGAAERVYLGIMRDLEDRRMVPGQRLVETDLAQRFSVGRNAVREAIQRLSGRGIVELSRNRSPSIRLLDLQETFEILDVAAAMTGLAARAAAISYDSRRHAGLLDDAARALSDIGGAGKPGDFSRARRGFYRALLSIGANRELQRLFPTIGMHIIYSQYQSIEFRQARLADYAEIKAAVTAKQADTAEKAARRHVEEVRARIASSDFFSRP